MKINAKIKYAYLLTFILASVCLVACGKPATTEIITERSSMIEAFAPVNEAILKFHNLQKGTITTQATGTFMPGGTVTKDECIFEKIDSEMHYKVIETYTTGDPYVLENVSKDGVLPESAYIYYPSSELDDKNFATADKITITKTDKGTAYRVDWSLTQFQLPEGAELNELYSVYTIDAKGYLVMLIQTRTYSEKNKDGSNNTKITEYANTTLTDYSD